MQASADGNALTYIANGPFAEPEGSRSLEPAQILSTRDQAGVWSSKDIVTPNSAGTGIHTEPKEYEFFSPDLALALLQPYIGGSSLAEPPLAPPASPSEAGHQEKTPYLRADAPLSPQAPETPDYLTASHNGEVMNSPGYLPLLTAASLPGMSSRWRTGRSFRGRHGGSDACRARVHGSVGLTGAAGRRVWVV